jgi:hypothetical protein
MKKKIGDDMETLIPIAILYVVAAIYFEYQNAKDN